MSNEIATARVPYIYIRGLQRCFAARNCCEEPRRGRVVIIFFLSYVYLYRYNNAFLFLRVRVIESRKDIYNVYIPCMDMYNKG